MAGLFSSLQLPQGGIFGEPAAQQQMFDPRIAMAAQLLGGTHSNEGFNTVFGRALMAGQQARQQAAQYANQQREAQQNQQYRQAQIQALQQEKNRSPFGAIDPDQFTPESLARFQQSGNFGDLVPKPEASTGINSPFGNINPGDFEPLSIERYRKSIDPKTGIGDFSLLQRVWAPPAVSFQSTPGLGGAIVDPGNRLGGGQVTPITTPEQERAAQAAAEQAQKEAEARGVRSATFNSDIARIDDEIVRTERLLKEFRSGKYQTGPVAGMLPNMRTAAQDLAREQGKDVISAISSATFGALSEGERAFLRELGVSEKASEQSNINMLTKRAEELRRAKTRLMQQNQSDTASVVRKYNPETGRIE